MTCCVVVLSRAAAAATKSAADYCFLHLHPHNITLGLCSTQFNSCGPYFTIHTTFPGRGIFRELIEISPPPDFNIQLNANSPIDIFMAAELMDLLL